MCLFFSCFAPFFMILFSFLLSAICSPRSPTFSRALRGVGRSRFFFVETLIVKPLPRALSSLFPGDRVAVLPSSETLEQSSRFTSPTTGLRNDPPFSRNLLTGKDYLAVSLGGGGLLEKGVFFLLFPSLRCIVVLSVPSFPPASK